MIKRQWKKAKRKRRSRKTAQGAASGPLAYVFPSTLVTETAVAETVPHSTFVTQTTVAATVPHSTFVTQKAVAATLFSHVHASL